MFKRQLNRNGFKVYMPAFGADLIERSEITDEGAWKLLNLAEEIHLLKMLIRGSQKIK